MTQMRRQVLTIPASALQRGPDGLFTYAVQADSTVSVAPLTASEPVGDVVVVEKGLAAGDQVVTSNFYRLAARRAHPCQRRRRSAARKSRRRTPPPPAPPSPRREHLPALHRAPGRHHAADGGPRAHRHRRLSLPAGGTAAAGGLPDHPGERAAAGCQPGDHGHLRSRSRSRRSSRRFPVWRR